MPTNLSKNTITKSAISKSGAGLTWDEATMSWDTVSGTWDLPGIVVIGISKSSITKSAVAKS